MIATISENRIATGNGAMPVKKISPTASAITRNIADRATRVLKMKASGAHAAQNSGSMMNTESP
jgi:hypothetical protein